MTVFKKIAILTAVLLLAGIVPALAAGGPPGPPTGPPPCWPPPCSIPLDGGVSLLIAAGVAYGGKKIYDSRTKKNPA